MLFDDNYTINELYKLHGFLNTNYNYFEIILLNYNAKHNDIYAILSELNNIRIIELSSCVDIEVAHTAIIENCIGDICVIMDLSQDSISDLTHMLEHATCYDIVIGKREKKIQSWFEAITSKFFYKAIFIFTGTKIDGMYSDFCVINRKVINFITKNQDRVKYLKLLQFNNGFSKFEYSYMPIGKKTKRRSFLNNINFTLDILVHYSNRLIRMATILSLCTAILNLLFVFYALGIYAFSSDVAKGWTSSNVYNSLIFFILFLVLAVIGEYIRMILQNQKNSPLYEVVDDRSSIALFLDKKNIEGE